MPGSNKNNNNLEEQFEETRRERQEKFELQQSLQINEKINANDEFLKLLNQFGKLTQAFHLKENFHEYFLKNNYVGNIENLQELLKNIISKAGENLGFTEDDVNILKQCQNHLERLLEDISKNSTENFKDNASLLAIKFFNFKTNFEIQKFIKKKTNSSKSESIEPMAITDLANDMQFSILINLDSWDIVKFFPLNKTYNALLSSPSLDYFWKNLFKRDFPRLHGLYSDLEILLKGTWRELYLSELKQLFLKIPKDIKPFIIACFRGDKDFLIEQHSKFGVDYLSNEYETLVAAIAYLGHQDMLNTIFRIQNFSFSRPDDIIPWKEWELTAVWLAVKFNQLQLFDQWKQDDLLKDFTYSILEFACSNDCTKIIEWFSKEKVDFNKLSGSRETSFLYTAINKKNSFVTKLLLKNKVDPNIGIGNEEYGATPLKLAIEQRDLESVHDLLKYKADTNKTFSIDWITPLMFAIECAFWEVIPVLLEHGANPNAVDSSRRTALYFLIGHRCNQEELILKQLKLLISHGVNVTQQIRNTDLDSILYTAINKRWFSVVELLLEKKVNPNIGSARGKTPLALAIEQKNLELVNKLLENDADANENFPLMFSIQCGFWEAIPVLLERVANPNAINSRGKTALYFLFEHRRGQEELILKQLKLLISHGVNVTQKILNTNLDSILYMAIDNRWFSVVELLLEKKVNPNIGSARGKTPLALAIEQKNLELVNKLLKNGADVNKVFGFEKYTPLMFAICDNFLEAVSVLLQHKANPNVLDAYGRSALHILFKYGHCFEEKSIINILKLLIAHGADVNKKIAYTNEMHASLILDDVGNTVLSLALRFYQGRHCNLEIIKMLLIKGANPNEKNDIISINKNYNTECSGKTPLDLSTMYFGDYLFCFLKYYGDFFATIKANKSSDYKAISSALKKHCSFEHRFFSIVHKNNIFEKLSNRISQLGVNKENPIFIKEAIQEEIDKEKIGPMKNILKVLLEAFNDATSTILQTTSVNNNSLQESRDFKF